MAKKDFDKLPIAEQRVIIAKDLIARLDAKKFIAASMVYMRARINTRDISKQLRDAIGKTPCKGCQIGGMFLCAVDRHDDLQLNDVEVISRIDGTKSVDADDMRKYLGRWFSDKTLQDVEAVFEGEADSNGTDWESFYYQTSAEERMRLIAKNIIKNKGRFISSQLRRAAKAA